MISYIKLKIFNIHIKRIRYLFCKCVKKKNSLNITICHIIPEKTANNKSEKKQKINDFILEFFEECSHLLNGKTMKELQEVLSKLLRYYI